MFRRRQRAEQLPALGLGALDDALQLIGCHVGVTALQAFTKAHQPRIDLLQLSRRRLCSFLLAGHVQRIASLDLFPHFLNASRVKKPLADRIEQGGLRDITANADRVGAGAAIHMTAAAVFARVDQDVVRAAGLTDEQAREQILRFTAALDPLIVLQPSSALRPLPQIVADDAQTFVLMADSF